MDISFAEGVKQFEFKLQRGLGVSCLMFHIERELYHNNNKQIDDFYRPCELIIKR